MVGRLLLKNAAGGIKVGYCRDIDKAQKALLGYRNKFNMQPTESISKGRSSSDKATRRRLGGDRATSYTRSKTMVVKRRTKSTPQAAKGTGLNGNRRGTSKTSIAPPSGVVQTKKGHRSPLKETPVEHPGIPGGWHKGCTAAQHAPRQYH